MLNEAKRVVIALLHVHIEKEIAVSPLKSPYGSIIFSKALAPDQLGQFISFVETKLKSRGAKKLTLKNPPEIYGPAESECLKSTLAAAGYKSQVELSAVIPITKKAFESDLHESEQKRLRKCKNAGLTFKQFGLDNFSIVYQFLKTCREQKEYSLSMSHEEILRVINVFPDAFFLTGVMDNDRLVAANISIQVNARVLYNFYHGHDAAYDAFSPVVLLNKGLYRLCQDRKLELLDLGTSQIDGKLNESLFSFKLKLGANVSNKFTFVKSLA